MTTDATVVRAVTGDTTVVRVANQATTVVRVTRQATTVHATGVAGVGVPGGGLEGQTFEKTSDTAYDATWRGYDPTARLHFRDADATYRAALDRLDELLTDGPSSPALVGQALRRFRVAIANRDTAKVDIVVVGDSLTEGFNATTRAESYCNVMADRLAAHLGQPTGHARWVPASPNAIDPVWSNSGGAAAENAGYGIGKFALYLPASGWAQVTQDCDRITLLYPRFSFLAGTFRVYVDGVLQATLNHSGSPTRSSLAWDSGALAYGPHTLRIEADALGCNIEGAYFHRGDHDGLRVWNGGHANASTNYFRSGVWCSGLADTVPAQLVVINLASNDTYWNWGAATTQAYLEQTIDLINTAATVDPSVVLVVPWRNNYEASDSAWDDEVRRPIYRAAQSRGAAVCDLGRILGQVADNTWGLYDEGVHPNTLGQRLAGEALARWLLDAIGDTGPAPAATPSGSALLAELVTVDGTGSGLDADLLDGQHAAAFATAGHNHTGVYDPAGTAAALVDDLSGVTNAASARTALGLGTAAVVDTGTGPTNAILGNDSRLSDTRTPTAGSVVDNSVASNAAIALSKLASISTARILGRTTAGSGAIEELPQASVFAFLGTGTPSATTYLRGDGSWSTPASGGSVATDTIFDAKGDLAVGTGADTASRLAVGTTNGHRLMADSSAATGVSWTATPTAAAPLAASLTGKGVPGLNLAWGSTSSGTPEGYVNAFPFTVSEADSFDAYLCRVDSGVASRVLDIALYSCANWKVGTTMSRVTGTDTSGLDCSTNGSKTVTLGTPVVLQPGRYVLVWLGRGGTGNINLWYLTAQAGFNGTDVQLGTSAPQSGWVQTTGASSLSASYVIASAATLNILPVVLRRG